MSSYTSPSGPGGMAWDHYLDLKAGRRTCGDPLCPEPYCFMDRDVDDDGAAPEADRGA